MAKRRVVARTGEEALTRATTARQHCRIWCPLPDSAPSRPDLASPARETGSPARTRVGSVTRRRMQLRGARSKGAVERALTAGTAVQCQRQEERGSGDRNERKRVALPGSRRRSMLAVVRDGYSQWNAGEAQRHATNGGRPTWREVARPEATGPWKSEAVSGWQRERLMWATARRPAS